MFVSLIMSKYMKFLIFLLTAALINGSPFYPHEEIIEPIQDEKNGEQHDQPRIYRLSEEVKPLSYELRIIPDLEEFTFRGKVEINILVKFSTNQIQLHSAKLTIKNCTLKKDVDLQFVEQKFKLDEINDLLIIETTQQLIYDTNYTLIIQFNGTLSEEMAGFYKSSYTIDNEEHWLAVTKFETSHARKAFPCFDEPRFRAPFTIFIAHHTYQLATSNMPIEIVSPPYSRIGGRRWTKFQTTPPMATYLVSYMVSNFTYITDAEHKIRVWTRRNAIQRASYALKQSTKLLKHLEGYTGISYKLPKLDVVAIPDFDAGAMENWGMTTYREKYVIVDEQASAEEQKSRSTRVICHEFSHMWFGDLVTPAWWDYTWLNEGFARYFEYFAAARVEPTWKLDQLFVVQQVQPALWREISTQRAMTTSVQTKQEIAATFDVISYSKAACVIRMIELVLSPATFRYVLHNYLKSGLEKHEGTVVPAHFYEALDEQSYRDSPSLPQHVSASQVMKSWTENIGFPLISVTRDYETGKIKIEQSSYKSPRARKPAPDQEWIVPLTYTTKSEQKFANTQPSLWSFAEKATILPIEVPNTDWLLFNLQHAGYYRVQYDKKNWRLLIQQLHEDHNKIHVLNRAQLLDDSLALAYDEKLCYHIALRLTQYLSKEHDMLPWLSAIEHFRTLHSKFAGTAFQESIREFIRSLIKEPFKKLGFDIKPTDDHLTKLGKPAFLYLACELSLDGCISKALKEYDNNKKNLKGIQPDIKQVVYCVALKYSSNPEKEFNNIWSEYLKSDIAQDKDTILKSLSCPFNHAIHETILKKLIDSKQKEIREQDRNWVYSIYSTNHYAADTALNYILNVVSKKGALSELDDNGIKTLQHLIFVIGKHLKYSDQADKLEQIENQLIEINQKKYEDFTKAAHTAHTEGRKLIEETKKRGEALENHLHDLLHPDSTVPPQETTKSPNSASSVMISSLWSHLAIAVVVLVHSLPM